MDESKTAAPEDAGPAVDSQTPRRPRVIPRDGPRRVITRGQRRDLGRDLYANLISTSWPKLALLVVAIYLAVNTAFALTYLALGDSIAHARPGSFQDAFFFSVQTMATIGFGRLYPVGIAANIVVTVEALVGFSFLATSAGLFFAKFSRPTARVLFSRVAVIGPFDGAPHFMFRVANERGNGIVDVGMQAMILHTERQPDGSRRRLFRELKLVMPRVPFLQLNWTGMHLIDEQSPLWGETRESLAESEAEIIVMLTGLEESFSQSVHARYSYIAEEIHFGMAFEDILMLRDDNQLEVSYDRFHDVKPAG